MNSRALISLISLLFAACPSTSTTDGGNQGTYVGFVPVGGFGSSLTATHVPDLKFLPDDMRAGFHGELFLASEGAIWRINSATLEASVLVGGPGKRGGTTVPSSGFIRTFDVDSKGRFYLGIDQGTVNVIGTFDSTGNFTEVTRIDHVDAHDGIFRVRASTAGDIFWTTHSAFHALNPGAPIDLNNTKFVHDCENPDGGIARHYCVQNLEITAQSEATIDPLIAGTDGDGHLIYFVTDVNGEATGLQTQTSPRDGMSTALFDFSSTDGPDHPLKSIAQETFADGVAHPGLVSQVARTDDGSYWTYTLEQGTAGSLEWNGRGLYVHRL